MFAMRLVPTAALAVLLLSSAVTPATAQNVRRDGFVPVRVDVDRNKVLLEITPERLGQDLLHQQVLATGAGSPTLGLDRGQMGGASVVRFELFEGTHSDLEWRYPMAIAWLAERLAG